MNKKIEHINFKKIVIIYIIVSIIAGIGLCAFLGYKYKDKLWFMYNYHSISEQFEDNQYNEYLQEKIATMSNNSNDIIDILVLDKNNNILFSSKNSEFSKNNVFELEKIETPKHKYFNNNNSNVVFKLVKEDELILQTIFSNLDIETLNEYKDDIFFESEFNQKSIYLLSYSANKTTGEKIYFINEVHPVTNGKLYLKITLAIIVFFFMLYWVLVALIVYQNALKLKLNPYLWGSITLLTNIAGVILYLLYKRLGISCKKCNTHQDKNNIYCVSCGEKLNETCIKCNHIIKKEDKYCPNCGRKI